MKKFGLLFIYPAALLASCTPGEPVKIQLTVELPSGTTNQNAPQLAASQLSDAASKACGKRVSVTADKFVITQDADGSSKAYKASAAIDCG